MILYLDASLLVKRYVKESGTEQVNALFNAFSIFGTSLITRAEIAAALKKAVRMQALTEEGAKKALLEFRSEWEMYLRLPITETLIARADSHSWDHDLRGCDAVHLAASVLWQESIQEQVTMATYDRKLWETAAEVGLAVWPESL